MFSFLLKQRSSLYKQRSEPLAAIKENSTVGIKIIRWAEEIIKHRFCLCFGCFRWHVDKKKKKIEQRIWDIVKLKSITETWN